MPDKKLSFLYTLLSSVVVCAFLALIYFSLVGLDYEWNFSFLWPYIWQSENQTMGLFLEGLWGTLYISFWSILIGSFIGIVVGLLLLSREKVSRWSAVVFVDIFRNTPLLVQLYVAYFVVGTAFELSAEQAGILTLSLFCSAYIADIFRGTLANFEKGQLDAAKSLGLGMHQVGWYVVMPQALRRMLPPLVGQFVSLIKDSSLVSVIGIMELTKSAMNVVAVSFKTFETWFFIAALYLILNSLVSSFGRYLEYKLSASLR